MTVDRSTKLYRASVEFSHPSHVQFIEDMEKIGYKIELRSKYMYAGPAVRISLFSSKDHQKALQATSVRCKVETTGKVIFVYPVATDEFIEDFVKMQPLGVI